MTYFVRYNQETNHLLDVTEKELSPVDGTVIEQRSGDIPDLSKMCWNPAVLDWYERPTETLSKVDFLNRFPVPVRAAIRTAAKQDPFVEDFLEMLSVAEFINLSDRNVTAAIGYLEYAGLITSEIAAEVTR